MAKILFVTTATAAGKGGHIFSLAHISGFIAKHHEVRVMNIGDGDSCILKDLDHFIGSVNVSSLSKVLFLSSKFKTVLKGFKPDVVHCFDEYSYLTVQRCLLFKKAKLAFTKCGGPSSPNKVWFHADNIVLFSKENYHWYQGKSLYENSNIVLLPNRVNEIKINASLTGGMVKNEQAFTFLRVGRIGKNYYSTVISLIDLVAELSKLLHEPKKIRVLIVGRVEDQTIFEKIKTYVAEKGVIAEYITDERTQYGVHFLGLADCVLGTGRSLMEAMSLGIPVLSPLANMPLPVLVDADNFHALLATNFSPRNTLENLTEEDIVSGVAKLIDNASVYNESVAEAKALFSAHLSIESAKEKYDEFYATALNGKRTNHSINNIYYFKQIYQRLCKNTSSN